MLTLNIDNDTREILQTAMVTAQDMGRECCTSADLLLALSTHQRGQEELMNLGMDERAISLIPGAVLHTPNNERHGRFRLSEDLLSALTRAEEFAEHSEDHDVSVLTLRSTLYGLLSGDSLAHEVLSRLGAPDIEIFDEDTPPEVFHQGNENFATPILNSFSLDLTAEARSARLDPVIGRDQEINKVVEILSRRKKNNVAVIGEAGVGKTAIVEGLANVIAEGGAPALGDARVLALDLARLTAGSGMRGALEERLTEMIEEVQNCDQEIIVFIDEAHALAGGGQSGSDSGAIGDILKPALARGQFRVIAATTYSEYRSIERDAALARRFSPVKIEEPGREDLFYILNGLRDNYASFHQVEITDQAIEDCIDLSTRYLSEGKQPDKAIDLLDTAAAKVRVQIAEKINAGVNQLLVEIQDDPDVDLEAALDEREAELRILHQGVVDTDIVAQVVSERTGVPVGALVQDERQAILKVEETLGERVVGHQDVISKVAAALRASRAGIRDERRPIGTFLFCGPTGVGKTEMAKALAEDIFGSEKALVRLDMSEYRAEFSISRLIGSPPGYVGYGRGGELTEAVFRRPYSVVLFDEIEKAHPDVLNTLLHILDDGRLTDSEGKVVDFTNTVIIMTSNVGSREAKRSSIGFVEQSAPPERIGKAIQQVFLPEFLNRIDYIANFSPLGPEEINQIADKMVNELVERVSQQGINLVVEKPVVEQLAEAGFSATMGARNMKRTIRDSLEQALAPIILDPETPTGATLTVHLNSAQEIKIRRRKR